MDERKPRPLWPWIVTTLIGLPVLYIVSSGPWYRLLCSPLAQVIPEPIEAAIEWFYSPLDLPAENYPDWFNEPYDHYLRWWGTIGIAESHEPICEHDGTS